MSDKEKLILEEAAEAAISEPKKKFNINLPWYFASGFLLFWALLFYAVVLPFHQRLPTALTMEDASKSVFIAERAYNNLVTLAGFGNKLTGSRANEVNASDFIVDKLHEILSTMQQDIFDLEIDEWRVSGSFPYKTELNVYEDVKNIAVKLSPKKNASNTYLLVNSHYDSKPATSSAGDAGFMIVTMLEVLRVIASSKQPIEHPIVFLFNGAEEASMQASHGFITKHMWAPFCKAVINLDAGGSGGREILLQSGPNHSWLINYYKNYIKYPFATTVAEEVFQSGVIPSDTDFTQFTKYGKIPGMDIAQIYNGFVYHTKYDTVDIIPRKSLQNTGDNVLSLVRGLANATELHDIEAHKAGRAVFYDILGYYFVSYTMEQGVTLNYGVAVAALVLIFVSIWRMAAISKDSICSVVFWFTLVFVIQLIAFVLALALPAVVAYVFDMFKLSLTYFSTPLFIILLYVCPALIGLSLPPVVYFFFLGNVKLSTPYHIQLALHAQAIILALLTAGVTYLGFRSAYIFMIPLIFYVGSLALNLLTTLHDRGYAWSGLVKISQIVPFLFSSYLFHQLIIVLVPINGRSGSATNRDLYVAVVAAAGTVLSFSFVIPLINTFRRPSFVVLGLVIASALGMYLASSTQLGFPYRPKTNIQRVAYLATRNMYYDYDGTLSKDESGYLFSYQDRREETAFVGTRVNQTGLVNLKPYCEKYMMCGMPLFDYRYVANRLQSKWLPRSVPLEFPGVSAANDTKPSTDQLYPSTQLTLISRTEVNATTVRFEFSLSGPNRRSLFFKANEDVKISNWSFQRAYLDTPPASPLAYHIYLVFGNTNKDYTFYVELTKLTGGLNVPLFQVAACGHYLEIEGDPEYKKFAATIPKFSAAAAWLAQYKKYIF